MPIAGNAGQQAVSPSCSSVPLLASKKLQALVSVSGSVQANRHQPAGVTEKMLFKGLKPDVAAQLQQAVKLIDERIDAIMLAYPSAMKKRLFAIRYGTVESLKAMPVKKALSVLGLGTAQMDVRLLANINYFGHRV